LRRKELKAIIIAHGHKNLTGTHITTLEITKETHLTTEGDCVIAVGADKAIDDLTPQFKNALRRETSRLVIFIEADEVTDTINARGSPHLILEHPTDIVVRRSDYISNRTLAIQADKAANDLSRELVRRLKDPKQKVKITLIVQT
jgi:uncharacterized protein